MAMLPVFLQRGDRPTTAPSCGSACGSSPVEAGPKGRGDPAGRRCPSPRPPEKETCWKGAAAHWCGFLSDLAICRATGSHAGYRTRFISHSQPVYWNLLPFCPQKKHQITANF